MTTAGKMMAVVLAGGVGSRLNVLTEYAARPKPAVPFGGKYRIIDFSISSIINSGILHTLVLTQYYGNVIKQHIQNFGFSAPMYGAYVETLGPEQHEGHGWYTGTANAVYQNKRYLENDSADVVAILAADHIFKIDLQEMYRQHKKSGSDFTIAGFTVDASEASRFGVMEVDESGKVIGFKEKPSNPAQIPGDLGKSLISMGVYLVDKTYLLDVLERDHWDDESDHDFGKNIIPALISEKANIHCWQFANSRVPGEDADAPAYWRDVGTHDAYMEAQMDLVSPSPQLNLYNSDWLLRTAPDFLPPAKIVSPRDAEWAHEEWMQSCGFPNYILSGGCIIDSPRRLDLVIAGRRVRAAYGIDMKEVVCFDDVKIGHRSQIRRTIIERGVIVPDNVRIGYDLEEDLKNGVLLGVTKQEWKTGSFRDRDPNGIVRIVTKKHQISQ